MSVFRRVLSTFLCTLASVTAHTQIVVTDDLGRVVVLRAPAQRIVSLAPSLTESLFAIGAELRIAGVTTFCNYPERARDIPPVGGMINPSIEAIVSRSPDLITLSMEGNTRTDFTKLTSLGIPVYVSNPRTLSGIYHSIEQLGILTGLTAQARTLIDSLKRKEQVLRSAVSPQPVSTLFFVSLQPLIVAGKNTLLNELLTIAGARNIADGLPGNYPVISREVVLHENPEVLLLTTDLAGDSETLTALFPEWTLLNAIRQHRVYRLNTDVVSRPGPRAVEGLELLIACLHGGTP
jgi:iron complex transport system substrate-binding protein